MKKLLAILLAAMMALALVSCGAGGTGETADADNSGAAAAADDAAAPEDETYDIVFISRGLDDMYSAFLTKVMQSTIENKYPNFKLTVLDMNNDFSTSVQLIENAITIDADCIIGQFLEVDPTGAAQQAMEAGIGVIDLDFIHEGAKGVFAQIVCDQYQLGALQAEDAAEKLPENAQVGILLINADSMSAERARGIRETLAEKRPDVTIVDEQAIFFDKATAVQITEDWITTYGKLDGILTGSDLCALGAIEAYQSTGTPLDGTLFYGVDAGSDACYSIEKGELTGSVQQSATEYAERSLELAAQYISGEQPLDGEQPFIQLTPKLYTADNVEELVKEYQAAGVMD